MALPTAESNLSPSPYSSVPGAPREHARRPRCRVRQILSTLGNFARMVDAPACRIAFEHRDLRARAAGRGGRTPRHHVGVRILCCKGYAAAPCQRRKESGSMRPPKRRVDGCRHRVLLRCGREPAGIDGGIISPRVTMQRYGGRGAAAAVGSPRACLIGFECPHQRGRLMLQGSRPFQQRGRRGGHIRALEPVSEQLVHQVGEPARSASFPRTAPQVLVTNVEPSPCLAYG